MPLVYQMIGIQNKELFIENNILNKVLNTKHGNKYDIKDLKELPVALANPIAIFKNYDSRTDSVRPNSFIVVVGIKSHNGDLTNIPILFNKNEDGHFILSIFPRENDEWYQQQIKHNRLLYIDRTKKDVILMWRQSGPHAMKMTSIDDSIPNEEDLRKLKEGNPSYYQSVRGVTSMYDDGRKLVELFDSANFSTFVHESGHVFLEDLHMLANMEDAPREVVRDWEAVKTWTGYQEGADADTNRAAHERFAQGFEAYVRDGSAPTKSLQRAFRQFATWLTKLYQKVSMLGGLPPKEICEVMDRMLATERDIESWANEREVERLETNDHMQNLSEQEQALFHDKVASIKERAKEKVRAEYMKEMEEQKKVPWEEVKGEAQARIEKGLVERYPIYRERARYEAFGI